MKKKIPITSSFIIVSCPWFLLFCFVLYHQLWGLTNTRAFKNIVVFGLKNGGWIIHESTYTWENTVKLVSSIHLRWFETVFHYNWTLWKAYSFVVRDYYYLLIANVAITFQLNINSYTLTDILVVMATWQALKYTLFLVFSCILHKKYPLNFLFYCIKIVCLSKNTF